MIEGLILAIVLTYAIKRAAELASEHWQGSKAANRKASKGKPVRQRAASAVQHDIGYWGHQILNGFPQIRNGLAAGWHEGRNAQLEGRQARAQARTGHAETRARVTEAVREQRRRQEEALERIRAAARQPEQEPEPEPEPAGPETPAAASQQPEPPGDDSTPVTPPTTEGTAMPSSGDTTYTQQLHELSEIRRDAEDEVNSVRRKRMKNRLDVLLSLGLDKDTLSEAAAIDDALQAQEKAAQQTLDDADAAIHGLTKRHGGIQEAVDSSPVDQPAQPEFYTD